MIGRPSLGWLWLAWCVCGAASAAPFAVPRLEQGIEEARPEVEVFEDATAGLTLTDVLARARLRPATAPLFKASTAFRPLTTTSDSAFWLRLVLVNPTDLSRRMQISVDGSHATNIAPLMRSHLPPQQAWARRCEATTALRALPQLARMPAFGLILAPGECNEILIRTVGRDYLSLQPHLHFGDVLNRRALRDALKEGALAGGLLMLAGFSLVWWLLSRHVPLAWQTLGLLLLSLYQILVHGLFQYFIDQAPSGGTLKASSLVGGLCPLVLMLYLHSLARVQKLRITGQPVFIALGAGQLMLCLALLASDRYGFVQASHFGSLTVLAALIVGGFVQLRERTLRDGVVIFAALALLLALSFRALALGGLAPIVMPGTKAYVNGFSIAAAVLIGLAFWAHQQAARRRQNETQIADLLGRQNVRLRRAVTRQTKTLNATLAAAQHTNLQQTRLMAFVGHDLRAPMATIVGYARLLRNVGSATHRQHIAAIERGAAHQLVLIDELLEHVRGELKLFTVTPVALDLRELLDDLHHHAVTLAARQQNVYVFDLPGEFPHWVMLDGTRLRQVLLNLLSNAAKFTREGRITLAINAHRDGPSWTLAFDIADTGSGIAAEDQLRIFESFEQAQPVDGGLGLGLFIARRLVENMGGRLTLTSALGVGSTFRFEITVAEVMPPPLSSASQAGAAAAQPSAAATPVFIPEPLPAAQMTSPASLAALSLLASNGQWSDINDWIAQASLDQAGSSEFIAIVNQLLEELDFDQIYQLATRGATQMSDPVPGPS